MPINMFSVFFARAFRWTWAFTGTASPRRSPSHSSWLSAGSLGGSFSSPSAGTLHAGALAAVVLAGDTSPATRPVTAWPSSPRSRLRRMDDSTASISQRLLPRSQSRNSVPLPASWEASLELRRAHRRLFPRSNAHVYRFTYFISGGSICWLSRADGLVPKFLALAVLEVTSLRVTQAVVAPGF